MPLYDYRCPFGHITELLTPLDRTDCCVCNQPSKRVWGFRLQSSPDQGHYNISAGRYIANRRELTDHAKRASDEATARTGIPHDFQPMDWHDHQALKVTNEGLDSIRRGHNSTSYAKVLGDA